MNIHFHGFSGSAASWADRWSDRYSSICRVGSVQQHLPCCRIRESVKIVLIKFRFRTKIYLHGEISYFEFLSKIFNEKSNSYYCNINPPAPIKSILFLSCVQNMNSYNALVACILVLIICKV